MLYAQGTFKQKLPKTVQSCQAYLHGELLGLRRSRALEAPELSARSGAEPCRQQQAAKSILLKATGKSVTFCVACIIDQRRPSEALEASYVLTGCLRMQR